LGTRNISISDEAYERLAALKMPKESFTDVINRLAGKKSILDLVGLLTPKEGAEIRPHIREARKTSHKRMETTVRRMRNL
jgi:predicted CopG family antitoxin